MTFIDVEEARQEISPASRPVRGEKRAESTGNATASLRALHVHAVAIAQEATARYREFAAHAADHGDDAIADLFSRLFEFKAERAIRLAQAAPRVDSPKLALGEYAWLYSGAPLQEARDFIFRLMTSRQALEVAMQAEQRAKAFFDQTHAASNDAGVCEMAIELGRDEAMYIAWLRDARARLPEPFRPGEEFPGDPATLQAM
jgi:hypothetical protein